MRCSRPFMQGTAEFGCGQCMPCRVQRRRLWTARLMLEAHKHEHSLFVTLTYKPEEYPKDGSVSVSELQDFFKRLRERVKPRRFRYYGVGEYGDVSGRAHYHVALFGLSSADSDEIKLAWGKGLVHIGTLTPESASYIVSYVVKRMTKKEDVRLDGRKPEFARMSLGRGNDPDPRFRGGIGVGAAADFGDAILNRETGEYVGLVDGDVPSFFKWQGRSYPLGRYIRRKVRESVSMPEAAPKATGELRSFRRAVDLRQHGLNGWRVREEQLLQAERQARKKAEISNSRKGIGI